MLLLVNVSEGTVPCTCISLLSSCYFQAGKYMEGYYPNCCIYRFINQNNSEAFLRLLSISYEGAMLFYKVT